MLALTLHGPVITFLQRPEILVHGLCFRHVCQYELDIDVTDLLSHAQCRDGKQRESGDDRKILHGHQ